MEQHSKEAQVPKYSSIVFDLVLRHLCGNMDMGVLSPILIQEETYSFQLCLNESK
jgi:hypothetical protein